MRKSRHLGKTHTLFCLMLLLLSALHAWCHVCMCCSIVRLLPKKVGHWKNASLNSNPQSSTQINTSLPTPQKK